MKLKKKIIMGVTALSLMSALSVVPVQPVEAAQSFGLTAVQRIANNGMWYSRATAWHNGPGVRIRVQGFFRIPNSGNMATAHGNWSGWVSGTVSANSAQLLPGGIVASGHFQKQI